MDFVEWLEDELEKRVWRQATLASEGDLTTAQVSRVMSRQQNPGYKFCNGVAKAFKIPVDEVYQRAGLLNGNNVTKPDSYRRVGSLPQHNRQLQELIRILEQLSEEEKEEVVEYGRHRLRLINKRKRNGHENSPA